VAALLKLLNDNIKLTQPNFASAIVLELHRTKDSKYLVRALWKNNEIDEPISLKEMHLLDCAEKTCLLDEFMEKTENLIVKNFETDCNEKNN
jgi:hypothetical protein